MQERRKQFRKNLTSYSQVYDLGRGNLLGYLSDLTPAGAMVISEKQFEANETVALQLEIPDLENVKIKKLNLPARVAWCQGDISPQYKNIGLEFKEVKPEQAKILQAIMDSYEFRHEIPQYPFRPATKK
ncbi:MAG TPA: PilZ domain-containing protein [Anaerolineales bacterium]|nr:PilZ domain-containing protein [Anaerolineales bacterium]